MGLKWTATSPPASTDAKKDQALKLLSTMIEYLMSALLTMVNAIMYP